MKVLYVQDQGIRTINNRYYHTKSKYYFSKYLSGLMQDEKLTVLCGMSEIKNRDELEKYKDITNEQIEYKCLPNYRITSSLAKIIKTVYYEVKNSDMCYLRVGIASSFAGLICKIQKKTYMAILCEDVYENLKVNASGRVRMLAPVLKYATKRLVKNADYVYYVTEEYLQSKYSTRGKSLGCSDVELLYTDETSYVNRIEKIESMGDDVIIGTVGGVDVFLKGQDILVNALGILSRKGYVNYSLEVIGSGNTSKLEQISMENNIREKVKFLGEKKRDAVLDWMNDIDIYIHPSRSEALPRTILEAMSKATPCICSKVGGVPELINEKYLFDSNGELASEELANLIIQMDKEEMKKQSRENINRAKQYAPDKLSERFSSFLCDNITEVRNKMEG